MKTIPAKRYFTTPKRKILYQVIYENPEEYLRHVETCLSLSDILACDPIAAFPFREFLSKLSEFGSINSSLVTAGKDNSPKVKFTEAYDFWQEVEEIRTTFFSLSSLELKKRVAILR